MNAEIVNILVPVGFVSVIVIMFLFALKFERIKREKVTMTYQKIADTFQLTFIPAQKKNFWNYTYPQVVGDIDGARLRLMSYITGGKNKSTFTNLTIASPSNLPTMKIVRKGVFQKIAKTFGAQDIIIGNDELDAAYMFKCEDEALFIQAIDPEIQQLLLHLKSKLRAALWIDKHNNMIYEFINHIDDELSRDDFEKVLLLMLKIEKNLR